MKKLLKISTNEWFNFSRDKRELSVVRELGVEVMVMAKGTVTGVMDDIEGFPVYRVSTRPLGKARCLVKINRILSVITWAYHGRRLKPDVISGHDIEALAIGYISSMFLKKKNRPKLVYDSHEFELGRSKNRNKFTIHCIAVLEKFLMKRCTFSMMVNESIAGEVQKIHHLSEKPVVVRNIPPCWTLNHKKIQETREEILASLNLPLDTFICMYHGALYPHRGIENMLKAAALIPDVAVVLLGNGSGNYVASLKELIKNLSIENRVLFKPAIVLAELYKYVGAVDVGMIIVPNTFKSYFYMLPNKFFENIQSLTPVIVSDFPEIGLLTRQYGVGLAINPMDIFKIKEAINILKCDTKFYAECKIHLKIAKRELCWENEKRVLEEAYSKVLNLKGGV